VSALRDFGCPDDQLFAAVTAAGFDPANFLVGDSLVRKKVPPRFQAHTWHQDGALGVQFPPEPGQAIPMTPLLTVWVALDSCGADAPGLELVRRRLDGVLHFTELNDAALHERFAADDFWAPALEAGDALVFLGGTLHRTHCRPEMRKSRLSVEYRVRIRIA
jgi:ectoine hydroxylase-related dioxygenase (phytanoyl-CoA dioxygenase family)